MARRCAPLHLPDQRPACDALIAATAPVHGLTLVSRKAADFTPTAVHLLKPWQPGSVQESPKRYRRGA